MTQDDIDKRAFALLQAADRLAAHNSTEWNNFVNAMGAYAEVPNMVLLHADHTTIHTAQGRARMAFELAQMFSECRKQLETLIAKRSAQARAHKTKRTL